MNYDNLHIVFGLLRPKDKIKFAFLNKMMHTIFHSWKKRCFLIVNFLNLLSLSDLFRLSLVNREMHHLCKFMLKHHYSLISKWRLFHNKLPLRKYINDCLHSYSVPIDEYGLVFVQQKHVDDFYRFSILTNWCKPHMFPGRFVLKEKSDVKQYHLGKKEGVFIFHFKSNPTQCLKLTLNNPSHPTLILKENNCCDLKEPTPNHVYYENPHFFRIDFTIWGSTKITWIDQFSNKYIKSSHDWTLSDAFVGPFQVYSEGKELAIKDIRDDSFCQVKTDLFIPSTKFNCHHGSHGIGTLSKYIKINSCLEFLYFIGFGQTIRVEIHTTIKNGKRSKSMNVYEDSIKSPNLSVWEFLVFNYRTNRLELIGGYPESFEKK